MRKLLCVLLLIPVLSVSAQKKNKITALSGRKLWLNYMDKVARPVLSNLAADELKANMPVMLSERIDNKESRSKVAYLEAFSRTMSGISPWLQLEGGDADEVKLRNQYRAWALKAIANSVNPKAKDYLQWNGGQPLVDASFLALALVRAPWLWEHLDATAREQLITAFRTTRSTIPGYSNWVLFTGMIETFFLKYGLDYDPVRIEYGVREFNKHWYVGDGMYADGMNFHFDYYNSIVIHPYLSTILEEVNAKKKTYTAEQAAEDMAGRRYAEILERLINTDGTYPITGRSITYRCGSFHHLANLALKKQLPPSLNPAQVRCALEAMLKKTIGAPTTINEKGWLTLGVYGPQPGLADAYITTGSEYLCAEIFLPLGLPATDDFWSKPDAPWTAVKVWSGQDMHLDHAMDMRK